MQTELFNFVKSKSFTTWLFPLRGDQWVLVLGEKAGTRDERTVTIIVETEQLEVIRKVISRERKAQEKGAKWADLGELVEA